MRGLIRTRIAAVALATALVGAPVAGAEAQSTGTIRGAVVNAATNRPLAGAQVVVANTNRGAITSQSGQYLISGVPAGNVTVRAQMVGYSTTERSVRVGAGETVTLDFSISPAAINLEEVVVTGTGGSTERRQLGNSLATVEVDQALRNAPVNGFEDLIQGRVAGVAIVPSSGTVGASGAIQIRGATSMSQGQDPLVYVDGVRVDISSSGPSVQGQAPSRILDIIPSDIERVEIIKGAAAATLYGTEASNGVIQIFTKKGRSGEPRWTAQIEHGLDRIPATLPGKLYPNFQGPTGIRARDPNEVIETGHQQSYSLSLSGGPESLVYYISGSYRDDEGSILPSLNFLKQASARMNLSAVVTDRLTLRANMGYVNSRLRLPNNDNSLWGVSANAIAGVPYRATEERPWGENLMAFSATQTIENLQAVNRFTGGFTAEHQLSDDLSHRGTLGIDVIGQEDSQFFPYGFDGPTYPNGYRALTQRTRTNITTDYRAVLAAPLTESISSSLAVGLQGIFSSDNSASATGRDFPGPGLSTVSSAGVITGSESRVREVNAGVFVEETVGFGDRLFLTGGLRVDGNSAFGDQFDYQPYPKVSAAYNISEESFWPTHLWPTMKLRAAYGTSGLAPAQFAADRTWTPISVMGGIPAVTPGNLGDPDLSPERSEEIEIGFDGGLFDNRVGLVVTYYRQRTEDALLAVPSAPSLGFVGSQLANVGSVRNSGIEVDLRNLWLSGERFQLETNLSVSTQNNEVLDLASRGDFFHGSVSTLRTAEGYPINGQWKRGEVLWNPTTRTHSLGPDPVYIGPAIPTRRGSLQGVLTAFNRVTLSAMLDGAAGHYISNASAVFQTQGRTGDKYLALVEAPTGARTAAGDSLVNYVAVARYASFVTKGDFLKLREVGIGYDLPDSWLQPLSLGQTNIRLAGRNLVTWTKYDGVDPEVNWQGGGTFRGTEFYTVPPSRRVSISIRTSF